MKKVTNVLVVLCAGAIGLALVGGAASETAPSRPKIRYTPAKIEALAIDGNRIAYDVGSTLGKNNNTVLVWNVDTGRTTA